MDSNEMKMTSVEMSEPSSEKPPVAPDNQLLLVDEQKMVDIEKPHHNDVLCGRGVTTNRHPGNESFRSLVGLNKELYVSSTKREKMSISRSIVQAVRSLDPPGRFLDKDQVTGLWHDIGHKKAVEKTSQALRDGAAMLRKQLSADLGNPNFLNAVFDDNVSKSSEVGKDKKGREKPSIKTNGKENSNNKDTKGNSSEKIKVAKAKSAQGKKGHRSPSALSVATSKSKHNKRYRAQEEPRTPGADYRWNYHQNPPSPRSPVPPHSRSVPNSPRTWGGPPPPHSERPRSYSYHHSPYNHPPPSPYNGHPDHSGYNRNHPVDHYHGPPPHDAGLPPRHHAWSPHGGSPHRMRYHPPPSQIPPNGHHYHHPSPPPPMHRPHSPGRLRPPTPPPGSSPGPLPPGHHTYAQGEFYPRHPPPVPEPSEPWSPRRGYVAHPPHREPYASPRPPQYSPHHGDYRPPERTPTWTPRPHSPQHPEHDYYDRDYPEEHDTSGGLSVPSLGGEGRPVTDQFSPKLHLAPRSNRPLVRDSGTPPRPHVYSDFRPPKSPRYPRSSEDSRYYSPRSSCEEEKKTSDADKIVSSPLSSNSKGRPLSTPEPIKNESRSSPYQEEIERNSPEMEKIESRASPVGFEHEGKLTMKDDDQSEEVQDVDDIAMSPIPYDREDPMTLMELPDDLLNLPLSSCGPHDNPADNNPVDES